MSSSSQIDTQFSGISSTSTYPPHNGLAVGPGYVVMAEGSRIEWTNLTGGAATLQSVYSFFGSLGTTATNSLYDPRCIYDSVSGRFIVTMENLGSNGAISNIDIAVSKDSNPNDGWYFASLNTALTINGQATASDRPSVSVDANNIYISAPQYNNSGGGWQGTESWVIGKTAGAGGGLYNGGTMTVVANQVSSPNQGVFAVTAGNNGKTYYACDYSTSGQIVLALQTYDTATNTFGPVTTISLGNIDQGGSYTAQQLGTTLLLDAGDKRVQNLVYSNGFLYGVAEETPIGSSVPLVHWFKIDVSNPNSPTLVAQGDISGASLGTNVATFNGSIAVSAAGDIIMNFTASGPNMYPSDYYVFQGATDPVGSFSAPILYQASSGFFNSGNGSATQRWGTYSTAIADLNNPHAFWISNEYVANNWWQTSVAQIEVKSGGSATVASIATSGAGISGGSGNLNAGKLVTLTVNFSSAVTVNTAAGAPTLALNDGGSATYTGGSGTTGLTFSYTVAAGQNTADLVVSSFNLNGATIRDGAGNAADLSGATNYNPAGILNIDTTTPGAPTGLTLDPSTDSGTVGDGVTNFSQVKIDGTAEAGSTVTLYDSNGTTVLGTGVASATTGAFGITTSTLSNGSHTITAKATDAASNLSAASTGYTVTINNSGPGAPTGLALDATTDSGVKGDAITNFAQAKIDGTAAPGSTVTLYDSNGTTVLGTSVGNATTGTFSITTSALSNGTHNVTAKASDGAGNVSAASAAYALTIDTTAPAAPTGLSLDTTTDSGTKGDGITNFSQAKIDGTAEPGSTVTLYDSNGTTVVGTGVANATTGTFSITTSALSNGTHNVTAKASDGAGNVSAASAAYALTIDTTAPPPPPPGSSEVETRFSGISDTADYPPHNALAVGPNNIVMLEGSRIEWTNLTGGSPTLQSKYQFFGSLGSAATNALFDPRAVYDPINQRYIVTIDNLGPNGATSNINIAVSKTSNPNDGWNFASLNTSLTINGQATVSDTPVVSVDGTNIYVTAPQYNVSGGGWQGTAVWVIGDTAGSGGGIYNGGALTVVANEVTSPNQGMYRVVAGNNGKAYYASSFSAGSNQVLTVQVYDVASKTFGPVSTIPLGNIDQGGSYTAQQKGTSLLLDALDKRVQNLAYSNGFLYGAMEEKPIGSTLPLVHWFKIDVSNPNSPTLVAQGDISGTSIGSNVATFNASIAVNGAGDVLINFTASGPGTYPSDYYVFHAASDTSNAFGAPILYQDSSGFFNSGNGSSTQRWGINSTTIADPADPHSFWVSNEYIANGWWQTVVAQVEIKPSPETPTLSLSNTALTVPAGGSVSLGAHVTPFDADDAVSVTISGLTSYETITDGLDPSVFSGSSVTVSAAEMNSGLTLHSSYTGSDHPVNSLTLIASNTTSGEAATTPAQTIVVTDPPVQTIIATDLRTIVQNTPQTNSAADPFVPMLGLRALGHLPPSGLERSAYATLASLFDQYMAAARPSNDPPGVLQTSWMPLPHAWFSEHAALARPQG
jgi:hypothetical protein